MTELLYSPAKKWQTMPFEQAVEILDAYRSPINSDCRNKRVNGKSQSDLYPYYGATGQVGWIDGYLLDGEYVLLGEDGAPFLDSLASKAYLVHGKVWVNNHAHILKSKHNNKFLLYYLNQIDYKPLVTGTTRLKLTQAAMKNITIPIPSLPEQERIVARIEELFSDLDKGVETLQTIKAQLKVYRQAVLKEAFEGKLTSEWRETNEDATWKTVLIDTLLAKSGKSMTTGPFGTALRKEEHQKHGIPVLGIESIDNGKFVDGNRIFVSSDKANQLSSFRLYTGDIIISRSGTVGELCVVPERANESLLSTNLIRLSLDKKLILPEFFVYLFQSKGVVHDQIKEICKGSTRLFINQTILKKITFPLPTINEQKLIILMLGSRLSVCDKIEQTVDESLAKAENLRQSILKKAFEGRL